MLRGFRWRFRFLVTLLQKGCSKRYQWRFRKFQEKPGVSESFRVFQGAPGCLRGILGGLRNISKDPRGGDSRACFGVYLRGISRGSWGSRVIRASQGSFQGVPGCLRDFEEVSEAFKEVTRFSKWVSGGFRGVSKGSQGRFRGSQGGL